MALCGATWSYGALWRHMEILLEEEFKIHPKMPNFLDKNQKQFKTEQANQSRKCTVGCGSHKLLIEAEVSTLKLFIDCDFSCCF